MLSKMHACLYRGGHVLAHVVMRHYGQVRV